MWFVWVISCLVLVYGFRMCEPLTKSLYMNFFLDAFIQQKK